MTWALRGEKGRPVVLHCGTVQPQRGCDLSFKLAVEAQGSLIGCALRPALGEYEADFRCLRAILQERGALLETAGYLAGFEAAQIIFLAANCAVLPYPRHYASSGGMPQALSAGRPVRVPDEGLMAHRVRSQRLGLTYKACDWTELRLQIERPVRSPQKAFQATTRESVSCLSREQVHSALQFTVSNAGPGATLAGRATPISDREADA